MEDPIYRELMDYSMRALSRRAHTVYELKEKLKKRPHFSQEYSDQIIERLKDLDLLDDDALIRRHIEDAVNFRFHGRLKVAEKLFHKGINLNRFNSIWDSMKIDEKVVAISALQKLSKKLATLPKQKKYSKISQFLSSRGFSPEIVFELAKYDE